MSIFSFIGGSLGFSVGGPIGAIVGFAVGGLVDSVVGGKSRRVEFGPRTDTRSRRRPSATQGDIHVSLIILIAAMMKADGKIQKSELDLVKRIFKEQFGAAKAKEMTLFLRDVLKQDYEIRPVCMQIRQYTAHPVRMQMMHYLIQVAMADGRMHPAEKQLIYRCASYLGVSEQDLGRMSSMFRKKVDSRTAYQILGLERSATDAEVKKAYRNLVKKYHPDRVLEQSPDFQKAAADKFRKIQEAYDEITEARGM